MAGEWIKVRTNLWSDPRVSQLCDLTDESKAAVVGALYWLWSSADEHTQDGHMPGLSIKGIDRECGVKGMGAALMAIGWLDNTDGGVTLVRFEDHNGASAKNRAQTAKRVATHKGNAKVTQAPLPKQQDTVTSALPREEKIREEEITPKAKSKADAAPASRLPADWVPSEADIEFCKTERPDLLPAETASRFRDYWVAQPGVKGRKTDWPATWRNWVRNERRLTGPGAAPNARASPVNEKFNFSHLDRSGDQRAMQESMIRNNITMPADGEEIDL